MQLTWKDFSKMAAAPAKPKAKAPAQAKPSIISNDGKTFTLGNGQTLSHVVNEWKKRNPGKKITAEQIIAANGNLPANRYQAGKAYKIPSMAKGVNNPFNMRHYHQKWLGEDSAGLSKGEMLNFKDLWHGFRAGSRNAANLMGKLDDPTISNFGPIYSPAHENDTAQHMSNISKITGIGLDERIDPNDNAMWLKFLKGLARAESGDKALKGLTEEQMMKAIESGRSSK